MSAEFVVVPEDARNASTGSAANVVPAAAQAISVMSEILFFMILFVWMRFVVK